MVWAALGKGLMGAGKVVGGAARTTGRGARMALSTRAVQVLLGCPPVQASLVLYP